MKYMSRPKNAASRIFWVRNIDIDPALIYNTINFTSLITNPARLITFIQQVQILTIICDDIIISYNIRDKSKVRKWNRKAQQVITTHQ